MSPRRDAALHLAVVLALVAILAYVVVRIWLFITLEGYRWVEKGFAVTLLFGEMFILLHSFGYALSMFRVLTRSKTLRVPPRQELVPGQESSVAVLVAARHEPKEVLEKTFSCIRRMDYPKVDIYFLDDSSEPSFKKEAEEICSRYGLHLFRREDRHGAKAGIINDCVKTLTQPYLALFDADMCPVSGFLKTLVPFLEADPRLALVQTPQFYTNINDSRIGRASAFQQSVFYEYICEDKSYNDSMFCCGTNIVMRREALADVGGFDETTVTEDFATSLKLHQRGWKTLYYAHVSTFGLGPNDLGGYFKQQFRWATGSLTVLKRVVREFFCSPRSLKPIQWWEYFLSSSYYLIGWAFFCLMVCPIAYLFFKIPSFLIHPSIYFFTFIPYIALSLTTFYLVLGRRSYRVRDLLLGQMIGTLSFSVLMRAAVAAFSGKKIEFGVTGKGGTKGLAYRVLWPQLGMAFLSFTAGVWGLNRYFYELEPAVLINAFWAFYQFALLSSVFYFNEMDFTVLGCRRLPKTVEFDCRPIGTDPRLGEIDLAAWPIAFRVPIREPQPKGTVLMCKVRSSKGPLIVFDGEVLEVRGNEATVGVVTATEGDRARLKECIGL